MGRVKKSTILFITEALEVHGNKYDYSKTLYIDNKTKVCVVCPTHGEFFINPSEHLRGFGCPECGEKRSREKKPLTTESFVAKSKEIHGDKYDYSKVVYTNYKTEVCITCPIHGEFWQTPKKHLSGSGCILCKVEPKTNKCNSYEQSKYNVWQGIFLRCGNRKVKSYADCTVCNEWRDYNSFEKWCNNPENGYQEGYQIDKDILVKGNREYSPDKCCFVPREINMLLVMGDSRPRNLPRGVTKGRGGKFISKISICGESYYLGSFDTVDEASQAYKNFKELYIKAVAEKYFQEGKITKKVYDALMKYEI